MEELWRSCGGVGGKYDVRITKDDVDVVPDVEELKKGTPRRCYLRGALNPFGLEALGFAVLQTFCYQQAVCGVAVDGLFIIARER